MAYSKTTWQTGDPITAVRMNTMEKGIEDAHAIAENALTSDSQKISDIETNITNLDHTVNGYNGTASLASQIASLQTQFGQEETAGSWASGQIHQAIDANATHGTFANLDSRFKSIDDKLLEQYNDLQANTTQIEGAKRTEADTLNARFSAVETRAGEALGAVNTLTETINNAGVGSGTLAQRLAAIDGGTTPARTLPNVIEEITAAHGANNVHGTLDNRFNTIQNEINAAHTSTALIKDGVVKTYDSLDARFEAIEAELVGATDMETRIDTIAGNVNDVANNKVNKTDIANNLTTTTTGKVLDATQGKILKDAIDNLDDAYKAADTALDGRLDAIDGGSALDTTNGTLAARVAAVETVASDAAVASTVNQALSDLDDRLDAIDNGSNTTISGIIDRLDDLDNSTDGRVKAAEDAIDVLEDALGTGFDSSNTVRAELNTKANSSDVTSALAEKASSSSVSELSTTVNGLLDKDTIVIDKPVSGSNYTNDEPNIPSANIKPNCDYLIQADDNKYYYWRYINNSWELISSAGNGGGGTGSSSGEFAASLSATDIPNPDENTDYFVGNNTIGYTHYRYVPSETEGEDGTFVKILPKGLLTNASVNSNGKPIVTTLEDSSTNLFNSFNALKTVNCVTTYDTDGVTPKSYALSFTDINGQQYAWDLAAGSGGSSYTVQFIDANGDMELYVPNNATSAIISARIYARLGTELLSQTSTITVKYKLESASDYTIARTISGVANNVNTNIDIIDLLEKDSVTNIQLTATIRPEDTPITRDLTYIVHRVPMSIEAYNYNPASIKTSNFNFQYYCIGSNLSKVVHFVIDNVETTEPIGINANTDLLTKLITVGSLERGMHSLKVYFTVGNYSSNEINTYFLYDDGTQENKPIIALSTNKTTVQDGESLALNYTVYTKGFEKTEEVILETYTMIDNIKNTYDTKTYENVDNSIEHTVAITNYPASGRFYMTMTAKHTVNNVEYTEAKTISVVITEYHSPYDTQMTRAGIANLIYEYDAAGRTNNDSDKTEYEYEFTAVSGASKTFTGTNTNFNWASNGYVDGSSLLISGGAVHTVDVPLFQAKAGDTSLETDTENEDILKNGRTLEIDYEVNTATNLNAEIASFGNGLKITPSVAYLVPQGTTVTVNSHGLIEREDEICAAYLATGKRMHMVFVIEPKSTVPTSQGAYHQCVNIYINGEFVNSCSYALSDDFSTNSTFTIGSNTCIINLYSIRMYNRGLTNDEVLRNYMMAPSTKTDKINRFSANDVLDNNKLVDYYKARDKFNCLLITGEISPYKKDTKTPSGVTLTKPDIENLSYTTEFELLDKKSNGTYYSSNNVQGTSSQTYPIHNLKVYLAKEAIDDVTGEPISKKHKYSLKGASGIAESTLCWKADYMSTDHANTFNANFANDLFTDKLPSQVADSKVQNTVYGIRCLLFQRDNENSTPVFIADGCLNNDKGNNNAFGLVDKTYDEVEISEGVTRPLNDTTRQKWEFTNNSSALDFFKADGLLAISNDDYYAKTAFESTYPDEGDLEDEGLEPNYNHLQVLLTWVYQRANYWDADDTPTGTVSYDEENDEYTTTGTVYTYNGIPYSNMRDYKKAIFKNEFTQHFNLNHALTYHLFSEFIALCDNRAKNMFLRCDNVKTEIVKDTSNNIIFSGNSNPNASFFENTANIGTVDNPIYALSNADSINWEGSTFAIWYPVLYDLDSCYGAENVGRITIPYDADWNYVYPIDNKKQFSGVDSRLWLMVEDAFAAELKTLAQTLYPNSLNYNTFYTTQIQAMLDSTCPAIINQDMLLKFNAFWADGFIDYSLPNTPHVYRDYKYIQRGSRIYQKDTFIKLRSNYLSSKYTTSNFMNDQIHFRSSVITPVSNSGITLTTNQTLYPAIKYGDSKPAIRSTNKIGPGESITLYAGDQVGNTDTIHIGGASALTDIGDISKFEPYNLDVSGGINLKNLVIGSNIVNTSTNKIMGLGSCVLLETLNVRNCVGFSGTLDLSGNGLIKNVYATGSGITNIELREGGNLTNIEYGALTSTIKIINHGGLQTFVYEDSNNNHYANVTRLHIENTPNVPIVDIVNNAMSHLTAGIRLAGLDIDLFENAVTEEERDAALTATTTFLNTIVSDLALHKYINSAGVLITNSTNYPYITGKIHITAIRASLLAKIKELYPNLIIYANVDSEGNPIEINGNDIITEYSIKYYNYGYDNSVSDELNAQWLLYEDHRTANENYIDPVFDTNPITGQHYCEAPTKPQDEEFIYTFGTYNSNGYVRYSGWKKLNSDVNPKANDQVDGNTIFIAQYPTTTRRTYTVTWYDTDNTVIYSLPDTPYGQDISNTAPEIITSGNPGYFEKTKLVNNTTYKVFKGWSRPLGIITGNTSVYAQWEESQISNATNGSGLNGAFTAQEIANLNAADLYALSRIGSSARKRLLENSLTELYPITIPMGHDFNFTEGVTTTNLLGNEEQLNFSGGNNAEIQIYNDITPLESNSNWTLAIDYKFILDTIFKDSTDSEYVLASCYKNIDDNQQGFKLSVVRNINSESETQAIQLSWGTRTVVLDNIVVNPSATSDKQYSHSFRNMIVLRHRAIDPTNLYVYYSGHNAFNYNLNIGNTTLTWENNTTIGTPLILGGNYKYSTNSVEIESTSSRRPAHGIIYWAKFWNEDLGNRNCSRLAQWTHEKEQFYLGGYNNAGLENVTNRSLITDTRLNFVAAQGVGDRYFSSANTYSSTSFNGAGWNNSDVRTFCNSRIYNGLYLPYQFIISPTSLKSRAFSSDTLTEVAVDTVDNIYLSGEMEVGSGTTNNIKRQEAIHAWPWLVANDYNVLIRTDATSTDLMDSTPSSTDPWRIRFKDAYVSENARIFNINVDPYNNGASWSYNNSTSYITVRTGDVWIYPNGGANGETIAYMYYTNSDIADQGIYIDRVTAGGGWVRADIWLLRTYNTDSNSANSYSLEKVGYNGEIFATPSRSNPPTENGRILCPGFSI